MKLFLLYLFAAFIAAANSLECNCIDAKDCIKDACTVDDGGSCISAAWNYTLRKPIHNKIQGCESNKTSFDVCKEGDLVFTAGESFSWSSVCCNTAKCNSGPLAVNKTATSKVCPTCFVFDPKPCHGKTTYCTGSQDYCLTISGHFQDSAHTSPRAFYGQGCATHSAKILVNVTKTLNFGGIFNITIATSRIEKAKDGASLVHGSIAFTVLLPYLLGLLLDKFLY